MSAMGRNLLRPQVAGLRPSSLTTSHPIIDGRSSTHAMQQLTGSPPPRVATAIAKSSGQSTRPERASAARLKRPRNITESPIGRLRALAHQTRRQRSAPAGLSANATDAETTVVPAGRPTVQSGAAAPRQTR